MRSLLVRLLLPLVILAFAEGRTSAAPIDPAVIKPVTDFIRAANAGNDKQFPRYFTADAVACDEVPPYRWVGPNAVAHWLRDDNRLITAHGITNPVISIGTPTFFHRSGRGAYATFQLVDAYTAHGKRQRETGLFTFTLVQTSAGWRITLACFAKQSDTSDASWDGT